MAKEETLTRRIMTAHAEHQARKIGVIEQFCSTLFMRLMSGAVCCVGLSIIPLHQWKHNDAPEIVLIVLAVVFVLLGFSGINPSAVKLAGGVAVQLLPAKWRGSNP